MGDMNIDLLKCNCHNKTNEYLDNLFSYGFIPTISKPTRVTRSSATLIDHINTNDITLRYTSGIIITDVADHFGTFFCSKRKNTDKQTTQKKTRLFTNNNIDTFKTILRTTNFDNLYQINCPNEAFNQFLAMYKSAQFKRRVKSMLITAYPTRVNCNNAYCKDCHSHK